jgi:hypothetical protein
MMFEFAIVFMAVGIGWYLGSLHTKLKLVQ